MFNEKVLNQPTGSEKLEEIFESIEGGMIDEVLDELPDISPDLHPAIADKLIERGYGHAVALSFHILKGLDLPSVVNRIIDGGDARTVGSCLKELTGLPESIALRLIEAGEIHDVARHLEVFQNLTSSLAEKLIACDEAYPIIKNLDKFSGLSKATALTLIDSWPERISNHLTKFEGLDDSVALAFIERGYDDIVFSQLEKFNIQDYQNFSQKILDLGKEYLIAKNLEKFPGVDQKDLAERLMNEGNDYIVLENLEKFDKLNQADFAKKMIELGSGIGVIENLERFKDIDYATVLKELIENKDTPENEYSDDDGTSWEYEREYGTGILMNLDKFKGMSHTEIAEQLIEGDLGYELAANIEQFEDVDHITIAKSLMKQGGAALLGLCENLPKFSGVDHVKLADDLINADQGNIVASYLQNFEGLDHVEIAERIIKSGKGAYVIRSLDKFIGIDQNKIAKEIIAVGGVGDVSRGIHHFRSLDKSVAYSLVDAGFIGRFLEYSQKFEESIFDNELAERMLKSGDVYALTAMSNYLEKFTGLDVKVAKKLATLDPTNKGLCLNRIAKHLSVFKNLDEEMAQNFIEAEMSAVVDKNPEYFHLSEGLLNIVTSHHLRISEALTYQTHEPAAPENERVFEILQINIPEWRDQENIAGPFSKGAAIFGEDKMFEYLDRKGLSRHDGLHQFQGIIRLYEESGLSPKEFYNNILAQVNRDDSEYYSGTAHHYLNAISILLSVDFEKTKELVDQYGHIEKLQELFKGFESNADIFSSWKNLKKYKEVKELLLKKDIMDQLTELKNYPEKKKLRNYIETLAFHPNITMQEVISFWRTPERFLGAQDSHTPAEVHNQKKPSNYIEFPNLDLSATDLRDALVEGDYDDLQSFKPFTIEYSLGKQPKPSEPLAAALNRALGKRSENKKGEAKNAPRLFKELQKLCREKNISLPDILSGAAEISPEHSEALSVLLYNEDMGLALLKGKTENYRAKINKKSDPDAVVAGNDTACCMPFGSGKNNVYTFNPNCSLFTLQKRNSDGKWRTIAQSVLTEDIEINRKIPEIIAQVKKGEKHLNALLTDDILSSEKSLIACDNVEVAESYKNKSDEIKIIYQDFFREYLKQFDESGSHFNDGRVVIGMGYTDALKDLPKTENKFIPRAPVGYSDKLGDEVFDLDLKKDLRAEMGIVSKKISPPEAFTEIAEFVNLPQGVEPLTFRDALPVAYIEGKAYAENESLIEYLHNMENALIAKDVNNAAKKRPNMSLKYIGDDKKMHGYILAYEGKRHKQGENVVYVSDLASDGNMRAGGCLILGFTESYKRNYIDTGKLIPIYAQMRENTSYPIIKKQLDKLAKGTGIHFQMQAVRTYEQGGDTMHEVVILPVNSRDR